MGVIVTEEVPADRLFGPIPPALTLTDPIILIGHMTADNIPDLHTVRVNLDEYRTLRGLSEWLPFVPAARDSREQNVEACVVEGALHYRTTRAVAAGAELRVWYTEELAAATGVPQLSSEDITDSDQYTCRFCFKTFRYPFSLRAHMRFKCEKNPAYPLPNSKHTSPSLALTPGTLEKRVFLENNISPETSHSSNTVNFHSPLSHIRKGVKRQLSVEDNNEGLDLTKRSAYKDQKATDLSPLSSSNSPAMCSSSSPENRSAESGTDMTTASAFHKVEKQPSDYAPTSERLSSDALDLVNSSFIHRTFPATSRQFSTQQIRPIYTPSFHELQMSLAIRQTAKENIPAVLQHHHQHQQQHQQHRGFVLKNREDLRNLMNCGKLPFHPDWRFQFPYIRSQNPIVEQLLTAASTSSPPVSHMAISPHVLQNWCAKCNATFRMTSDLVYHMRSHHMEEVQKVKPKPAEKLRCDVCGDRFKERHHLTRHMTSHQEV